MVRIRRSIRALLLGAFVALAGQGAFGQNMAGNQGGIVPMPYAVQAKIADVQHMQVPDRVHLSGMLGARIDRNAAPRLLEVDIDRLLEGYRKRPGRQTWDGEHIGKWLHAATLAWAGTNGPQKVALRQKLEATALELIKCQEDDGYLGTYLPNRRWREWDVWAHKYNLIGLLTYIQYTGDTRPLNACRKMADLLIVEFAPGPDGKAKRDILNAGLHQGMAPTSVLEPIVLLYRFTGDERYGDFARYIFDSWERSTGPHIVSRLLQGGTGGGRVDKVGNGKAYEMLSCLNGMLEWYRLTGDAQLLKAAQIAWQDIVDKRLYITGTASAREHFQDDFVLPNVDNVGETCVTVTWEQFNAQLLRLTGEARYADELEKTLYNQLAGAQRPDGKAWGYYVQMEGLKPFRDTFDGNCCLSSGPRGIALVPTFAWATDSHGIVVNLYESGHAQLKLTSGQVVGLDAGTRYPAEGTVEFTINPPAAGAAFSLKLRIPSWIQSAGAQGAMKVTLNGVTTGSKGPDGYWRIDRAWKPGEKVRVELPVGRRVIMGDHGNAGKVAFAWGPLILAYDGALNGRGTGGGGANLPGKLEDAASFSLEAIPAALPHKDWADARIFKLTSGAAGSRAITLAPFATAGAGIGTGPGGRYRIWLGGPDRGLPANLLSLGEESRSRQGNLNGSILDGETVVTFDGRSATDDWYAVTLSEAATIRRVIFLHGKIFHDGGWFDTSVGKPRVQMKIQAPDGRGNPTAWVTVGELTDYPATTASMPPELKEGQRFTCILKTPQKALAVRIIGKPACGDAPAQAFSSCGGLMAE